MNGEERQATPPSKFTLINPEIEHSEKEFFQPTLEGW